MCRKSWDDESPPKFDYLVYSIAVTMKRSRQDAAAPAAVSKISAFEPASEEIKFSGPCRVFLKDFDAGEGTVYITTQ